MAELCLWRLFEEMPVRHALHPSHHAAAADGCDNVDVGHSPPPNSCGLSGAAVAAVLGRFRGISSLELPVCTRLTAADVTRMAGVTSTLTWLGLSTNSCDCSCTHQRVDGAVMAALVSGCPVLEEVELSGVTDAVLEALVAHCPRLRMADLNEVLSGSPASAEAIMLAFVAACPKLRDFRPPGGPREGFVVKLVENNPGLPPDRLAGLASLDFVVSDAILATVAEHHPGLRCLDFAHPDSAAGFDTITQRFRSLTTLSLAWLEHPVPTDFLRNLASACPDLRNLDLCRTFGVTDAALCELRCPNLEDLRVIGATTLASFDPAPPFPLLASTAAAAAVAGQEACVVPSLRGASC